MRVGHLLLRMLFKAVAVLAVTSPWLGWAQVQTRPSAFAGVDALGNAVTAEAALRTLASQAAVAFVGTVTTVRRLDAEGYASDTGVVEVAFNVEHSLRGVPEGGTYLLREWAGLWLGGEPRYRTGARLLMLLHAPGASGLSSPVGGLDGAIPVLGSAPLVSSGNATEASDAQVVDLRWLVAKLSRPVQYRTESTPRARPGQSEGRLQAKLQGASMLRVSEDVGNVVEKERAALQDASVPTAQASVATVLQMMKSWEKEAADVR